MLFLFSSRFPLERRLPIAKITLTGRGEKGVVSSNGVTLAKQVNLPNINTV